MSQLSDVEVLYKLMGASHITYREIRDEESKVLPNTLKHPLNEIDLSHVEILSVTISEKIEPLLVAHSSIKYDLTETASLPADSNNFVGSSKPVAEFEAVSMSAFVTNVASSTGVISVNEVPVNNSSADLSSITMLAVQTPVQSNAELLPVDQNSNSEISNLVLRIKNSSNLDKTLSKQSFFERLQT